MMRVTFVEVDSGQHDHFKQLLRSLVHLGHSWAADWTIDEFHVKFGHVDGMSTRRGNVVFLRDILDEAQHRTLDKMNATHSQSAACFCPLSNCPLHTSRSFCSSRTAVWNSLPEDHGDPSPTLVGIISRRSCLLVINSCHAIGTL